MNSLKFVLFVLLIGSAFSANALDCLISWDPNPADEGVTEYIISIDFNETTVPGITTQLLCSEATPPIDAGDGGRHQVVAYAINVWGKSEATASVPFGPPSQSANVSVSRITP